MKPSLCVRIALFATIATVLGMHACPVATFAQTSSKAMEPTTKPVTAASEAFIAMGKLVGGVWQTEGAFKAEFRYTWRVPGKAIRGLGKAAIGTPEEFAMESMYGWDPEVKKVYYMDFHGSDTVYKGWVTGVPEASGAINKFDGEFSGLVGDTGSYRFTEELTDKDTLVTSLLGKNKKGDWVKMHSLTFKRHSEK